MTAKIVFPQNDEVDALFLHQDRKSPMETEIHTVCKTRPFCCEPGGKMPWQSWCFEDSSTLTPRKRQCKQNIN